MPNDKAGQIVWHDLFTSKRKRSIEFFQRVANWSFETEHATDYTWGGGEKDFVLALSGGEAGAGIAETPTGMPNGWIAYVEIPDVDEATARAFELGGSVVRPPFEVPGVGRNALLRDPCGALIGISLSRHEFPVPRQQFGPEIYVSETVGFPREFYAELFNWKVIRSSNPEFPHVIRNDRTGDQVALHLSDRVSTKRQAMWVPSIRGSDSASARRAAEALGAQAVARFDAPPHQRHGVLIRDPDNAYFCLSHT
jgi:hypothetical protein